MNSISVLILFLSLWPFSGGKTYHMTADSSVPAASGIVSVHRGGANRNTELDIKVSNLARPANLASPGNVYIVWLRPNGSPGQPRRSPRKQEPGWRTEGHHHFEGL